MREEQQEPKEAIQRPEPESGAKQTAAVQGSESRARERLFTTLDEENPMICRGID